MAQNEERKKSSWVIWAVLLVLAAVMWAGARHIPSTLRLLDAVNAPRSYIFSVKDRAYWEDWLNYVAGYEIIAAHIPSDEWATPDGWTEESITPEKLQTVCGIRLNDSELYNLRTGELPDTWDAWFFSEDEELSECWIGLYSKNGTLIVYRGLELWVAGGYWDRYE